MTDFSDQILFLRLYRLGRLPPAVSAAEILVEQGFSVTALEYGNVSEPEAYVPGRIPRVRWASPWAGFLPRVLRPMAIALNTAWQLARAIRRYGAPQLIVAQGIQEQAIAWLVQRWTGAPFAVQVHEIYLSEELTPTNRLFLALEGRALRGAEFLIFPEATREKLYRRKYAFTCPSFLVYNCPRLRTARRWDARVQWGLPADAVVLAYVGGIGANNCLEQMIEALPGLPSVYFLLWGWGEPEYLASLTALAQKCAVASRVQLRGVLDQEKWQTLDACDLAYCVYAGKEWRTQHQATASNKLMEAIASGAVPVVSNAEDFQAFVKQWEVGVAVSGENLASQIQKLLDAPEEIARQRSRALRAHQERLHYEKQFEGVVSFLQGFSKARGSLSK